MRISTRTTVLVGTQQECSMKNISNLDIEKKAKELIGSTAQWHYHFLTPSCMFNLKSVYAIVLEDAAEAYVSYYDHPPKQLSEELSKKLHGENIVNGSSSDSKDEIATNIVERAKKLSQDGKPWHHHVLFPDCIYNKQKPKFELVLENEFTDEVLINATEKEPIESLVKIEPLFYAQKNIE